VPQARQLAQRLVVPEARKTMAREAPEGSSPGTALFAAGTPRRGRDGVRPGGCGATVPVADTRCLVARQWCTPMVAVCNVGTG